MNIKHNNNRYPGSRPFNRSEAHLFKGRENEIRDLYHQVILADLIILFAKSGIGKSSLIEAGLIPLLSNSNLNPINIRLNENTSSPKHLLLNNLSNYYQISFDPKHTLWQVFKIIEKQNKEIPLIIFDQFEEFFKYHDKGEQDEFASELADILHASPPSAIQKEIEQVAEAANQKPESTVSKLKELTRAPKIKVLIAIRSSEVSRLDELRTWLPEVLSNRFDVLSPLTKSSAKDAIEAPAKEPGSYLSKPFGFAPGVSDDIIDFLAPNSSSSNQIEPFQLQILCSEIEKKIIQRKETVVTKDYLGGQTGMKNLIQAFYLTRIKDIGNQEQQQFARRLIESRLILNESRDVLSKDIILAEWFLTEQTLGILEQNRILRKEDRNGRLLYEVSHDSLIGPILAAKKIREAEEIRLLERRKVQKEKEEAIRFAKEKAERGKKLALEELHEKRRRFKFLGVTTFFLLASLVFSIDSYKKLNHTNKSLNATNDTLKVFKNNLEVSSQILKTKNDSLTQSINSIVKLRKVALVGRDSISNLYTSLGHISDSLVDLKSFLASELDSIVIRHKKQKEILKIDEKVDLIFRKILTGVNLDHSINESEKLILQGMMKLKLKEYSNAINDFKSSINQQSSLTVIENALFGLASAQYLSGNYIKAQNDFNEALGINPTDALSHYFLGMIQLESLSNYESAIEEFSQAITNKTSFGLAYLYRGQAHIKNGYPQDTVQINKGIKDLIIAEKLRLKTADLLWYKGWAYYLKEEYDIAIFNFNEANKIDPTTRQSFLNLGDSWAKKDKYQEALDAYAKGVFFDKKNAYLYSAQAFAWVQAKKFNHAINALDNSIPLYENAAEENWPDPYSGVHKRNYAIALNTRAYVLIRNNQYMKAKTDIKKSLQLDKDNGWTYANRAMIHAAEGRLEDCFKDLEIAIGQNDRFFIIDRFKYPLHTKWQEEPILLKLGKNDYFQVLIERSNLSSD